VGNQSTKKLKFEKETARILNDADLGMVNGGTFPSWRCHLSKDCDKGPPPFASQDGPLESDTDCSIAASVVSLLTVTTGPVCVVVSTVGSITIAISEYTAQQRPPVPLGQG